MLLDRIGDQVLHGAAEEDLADHRPSFDHRSVGWAQSVESCCEQGTDGRGDGECTQIGDQDPLLSRAALQDPFIDQHRQHLLHEQGVAFRGLDDSRARRLIECTRSEEVVHDDGALRRGEWLQRDGLRVVLLHQPFRMILSQFRTRGAEDDDAGISR